VTDLFKSEISRFITEHEHADIHELALRYKEVHGIPIRYIINQINGRQKAKEKLPTYYANLQVLYPPPVNLSQSSSEATAKFKARLVGKLFQDAQTIIGADLTSGFGIDTFFLSQCFTEFHAVEPDQQLLKIAYENHQKLGSSNITYHNVHAETFLKNIDREIDFIFIDPSRRSESNKKIVRLNDCEPNVIKLQNLWKDKSRYALIKTSPLLDIQQGLRDLKNVGKVVVLSTNNECKEVLFLCEGDAQDEPIIETVNLKDDHEESFSFTLHEEESKEITFSSPSSFLYEPNASVLKAGAFRTIGGRFSVAKLHPNTHLYTSDQLFPDFPGRIFRILDIVKPDAKSVKKYFPEGQANVTTRNYPLSEDQLKKKTSLKDGGENFLIAFTGLKEKYVCVASRVTTSE
jgi:hypothetical protein